MNDVPNTVQRVDKTCDGIRQNYCKIVFPSEESKSGGYSVSFNAFILLAAEFSLKSLQPLQTPMQKSADRQAGRARMRGLKRRDFGVRDTGTWESISLVVHT